MSAYVQLSTALMLGGAAYTDIRYKKIYNIWIGLWILIGILIRGVFFIPNVFAAGAALFIFHLLRVIGAGDIKLAALLYAYLGFYDAAYVLGIGMVLAALYSFYYLYSKGILWERLLYFRQFLVLSLKTNSIHQYNEEKKGKEAPGIALAPYFLAGFLIWRLYVLCSMSL